MALLTVNGTPFTEPDKYKHGIEPVGVWERNAAGYLVGDFIAYKNKLEMTWGMLKGTQYSVLLGAIFPFWLNVTFLDSRTNSYSSGEFYASPRSGELALIDRDNTYWWKNVSFNLIER